MTERKVIQVVSVVVPGMDNMTTPSEELVVLCDDGTLWRGGSGWWQEVSPPTSYPLQLETAEAKCAAALNERRQLSAEIRATHDVVDSRYGTARCRACGLTDEMDRRVCRPSEEAPDV